MTPSHETGSRSMCLDKNLTVKSEGSENASQIYWHCCSLNNTWTFPKASEIEK